jgi:hypothetical protein
VLSVTRALTFRGSQAVLYVPNAKIAATVCIKRLKGGFVEGVDLERPDGHLLAVTVGEAPDAYLVNSRTVIGLENLPQST